VLNKFHTIFCATLLWPSKNAKIYFIKLKFCRAKVNSVLIRNIWKNLAHQSTSQMVMKKTFLHQNSTSGTAKLKSAFVKKFLLFLQPIFHISECPFFCICWELATFALCCLLICVPPPIIHVKFVQPSYLLPYSSFIFLIWFKLL